MKRTIFIPLIVTATFLVIVSVGYGLAYYQLTQATQKATSLETEITEKTSTVERLASGRTALQNLAGDEELVGKYSIRKAEVAPFLEELQASGKPLGSTIEVLSVADAMVAGHPRITLSLAIKGSFDAVMRTLGTLEYGPYDGVLTNLTLDTIGGDGKNGNVWTAAAVFSLGVRQTATTTKP